MEKRICLLDNHQLSRSNVNFNNNFGAEGLEGSGRKTLNNQLSYKLKSDNFERDHFVKGIFRAA